MNARRTRQKGWRRVVVVVSHPIQYFAPLYRAVAAANEVDLLVLFASKIGLEVRRDVGMGVDIAWNTDLTGGYAHRFLTGADAIEHTSFFGVNNPNVGAALAESDPEVLLLHGYAMVTYIKTLIWARLHRRPVIMVSDTSVDSSAPPLRRWLKRLLMPTLLGQFSAFLTQCDRAETYLENYGVPRDRMVRCPQMLDQSFWIARRERAVRRAAKRAELGIGDEEIVLLVSGKLIARKRIGDVIAALAGLELPLRLIVVGDGELRSQLHAAATSAGVKADFLGFINIDALPDVYATADVFVHAAEFETYGMVVLEAASVGLPIIVSDLVGAVGSTSIAQPDVNALVYRCGDVEALRAAIFALASDPERLARFAEASLVISEDHRGGTSVAALLAACGRVAR